MVYVSGLACFGLFNLQIGIYMYSIHITLCQTGDNWLIGNHQVVNGL